MLWVACNARPCLLKVHPDTLAVTEVKLPTPKTTVRRFDFGPDGTIWFVNSGAGKLGRLNPKTGEIKEWPSPSGPNSHPYGFAVVNDIIWYNESEKRPDALVRFDPRTEQFQSWAIPSGGVHAGIVRHMRPTADGDLLIQKGRCEADGAVAIGHPTGASGARLVLTAARALAAREGRWGAVAICGGFGQTDAVLLERPS